MKIVKKSPRKEMRTVSLRIEESIMAQVDKIADENSISRQAMVAAILKQVLKDPKFILKIED